MIQLLAHSRYAQRVSFALARARSAGRISFLSGKIEGRCNMAKGDALKAHIEALRSAIPELKGVLLASNEGLPIAHSFSNGQDPNRVAAMAAAASSLGRRISDSMSAGTLGEVSIQSDDGALFVYSAGSKAVLAVISPQGGNAGLIHLEARSIAKDIGDLF